MRLEDFISALHGAGWGSIGDAQHDLIEKLWRELFPCIAELEAEIEDLEKQVGY